MDHVKPRTIREGMSVDGTRRRESHSNSNFKISNFKQRDQLWRNADRKKKEKKPRKVLVGCKELWWL